jgi:hypothetical protein
MELELKKVRITVLPTHYHVKQLMPYSSNGHSFEIFITFRTCDRKLFTLWQTQNTTGS